jgi:predicted dehydrogenase
MKTNLSLGFIGGGTNSTIGKMHYLASKLDSKWKLVSGFFSRNKKINIKSGISYNVNRSRIYHSLQSFIKYEKKNLDAVVLLTSTPTHCKILKKLIKIDLPIISEKPLINSPNQMKEINKIFSNKKNLIRVTYNYTGYPILRELKEMIKKKRIGKIKQFFFYMPQNAFTSITSKKIRPKNWRLNDVGYPSIFGDLGSHLINMCDFLLEKTPRKVFTKFFNHSKYSIIDNAYFTTEINKNIFGQFIISKTNPGISNGLELKIVGTSKTVTWKQEDPEELLFFNIDGTKTIFDRSSAIYEASKDRYNRYKPGHPSGFLEAFANIYYDIANEIISKKKSKYTFDIRSSHKISNFFDASIKSEKSGKWIKVN